MLRVFVDSPWLAVLPGLAFGFTAYRRRRRLPWAAAAAWLVYAIYETAIASRIICSGECNIRIDLLLLIYPLLLVLSVAAIVSALRARRAATGEPRRTRGRDQ